MTLSRIITSLLACILLHASAAGYEIEKKVSGGKTWLLLKDCELRGASDLLGNTIVPVKFKDVSYIGNLGYRDYYIVKDANLEATVTGTNYSIPFQGVYSSNGEEIIPTDRGYTYIWGFKSEDSGQLYYEFEINFCGVEMEGICDVHGRELWCRDKQGDHVDAIAYSKNIGFYYISSKTGEKVRLGIKIPSSDSSFRTHAEKCEVLSFNDRIKSGKQVWENLDGGFKRRLYTEPNSFEWYKYEDGHGDVWAQDKAGTILVPPRLHCVISFCPSNFTSGFFTRNIIDDGNYREEAYTKEGNVLIPESRGYLSIRYPDPTKNYIVVSGNGGYGIVDLNGYEVVEPEYRDVFYDGYDFYGVDKYGQRVKKHVHDYPTKKQAERISSNGGYYSNMPWLLMPGPGYTPYFDINQPVTEWPYFPPPYGGIGDYNAGVITAPVMSDISLSGLDNLNGGNEIGGLGSRSSSASVPTASTHKCAFCNGTGRKSSNSYGVPTYGTSDPMVHCNECGRDFPRSSCHTHIRCSQCGGTGIQR